MSDDIRYDWQREEIRAVHDTPLLELVFRAASVHRRHHLSDEVQVCKLVSIKTGACPEDCAYCAQSARYETGIEPQPLMDKDTVVAIARRAKANGVSRVCLGAAWREVRDNPQFDRVLEMVKEVTAHLTQDPTLLKDLKRIAKGEWDRGETAASASATMT